MITLTYLEFYSGIGGWGYALEQACRSIVLPAAAAATSYYATSSSSTASSSAGAAINTNDNEPHLKKSKIITTEIDNSSNNNYSNCLSPSSLKFNAKLLAAFDHSDLANSVFHHNHILHDNGNNNNNKNDNDNNSNKNNHKDNVVKQYNKQHKPTQTPIQRLTTTQLESHSANIWCMSPPCQPHTRQHSNQHQELDDPRSASFLHLCHVLEEMKEECLPELILLENVVGFDSSMDGSTIAIDGSMDGSCCGGDDILCGNGHGDSEQQSSSLQGESTSKQQQQQQQQRQRQITQPSILQEQQPQTKTQMGSFQKWRTTLSKRNYHVGHFHLDPTHVGIPNNRPRYYCVAFRKGNTNRILDELKTSMTMQENNGKCESGTSANDDIIEEMETLSKRRRMDSTASTVTNTVMKKCDKRIFCIETLANPPIIHNEKSLWGVDNLPSVPCINSFLDANLPTSKRASSLQIPEKVRTSSSSWCFDIVTPYNRRSACFTHSYGKFIRGTGSILYSGPLRIPQPNGTSASMDTKIDNNDDQWCKDALLTNANTMYDETKNEENAASPSIPSMDRFQLALPEDRSFDANWSNDIDWDAHMRYLSGTEIARLMGFPVLEPAACDCSKGCSSSADTDVLAAEGTGGCGHTRAAKDDVENIVYLDDDGRKFAFPPDCTIKQQWKLLGNSLNVRVAACVAEIGIRSILNDVLLCNDEQ